MAGTRLGPGAALNQRTGILGGSFNPAHGGHRRISRFIMAELGLDELWWLVSPGNPLKAEAGMAPLASRFASAKRQAGPGPIRVSAVEHHMRTRYTIDTLRKLRRRWPKRRFVWIMGSDNLAQFSRWKNWRGIARLMPIAVVARPGYDGKALASPAMGWLRRYRRRSAGFGKGAGWSAPALVYLRFDPDRRSATTLRQSDPQWASRFPAKPMRDSLTHRLIPADAA